MTVASCPAFLRGLGQAGCCVACGKQLEGRRRRWCSDECVNAYSRNHSWTSARWEALRRATVSVPVERPERRWVGDSWSGEMVTTGEMETVLVPVWRPCENCGVDTLEGSHRIDRRWTPEGTVAERAGRLDIAPEVNHVDPRHGGDYDGGCWNHQSNLEVLCHACHVCETKRQAAERAAARGIRPRNPMGTRRQREIEQLTQLRADYRRIEREK